MANQTKYTNKLQGKHILIIGGTSGIGYGLAEACLEYSANVTISSSNPSRLSKAIEKLKSAYPSHAANITGIRVDLSNPDTLENDLETLLKSTTQNIKEKKLDHVIFTAGDALPIIPLKDMTMQKILKAGQIRFFAPLLLAKFLPTYLHSSPDASYIITSGSISERPMPNWSVIGSYAGGHHSMVRGLALDLKPIRVNGVAPGVVDTELWGLEGEEREKKMVEMGKKCATGRAGRVEDVVECYLACLRDGNITGSVVDTNGGGLFM